MATARNEDKSGSRSYDNTLRQQQSEQTRERILESLLTIASDSSVRELSIPRLAKLAGVSQPTVYRHFPNREALFQGFEDFLKERTPFSAFPADPASWPEHIRSVFVHFDANEDWVRASLREGWGADFRRQRRQRRLQTMRQRLDEAFPDLPPLKRQQLFGVLQLVGSSEGWLSLKDNAGLDGAQAGEAVAWALKLLLESARSGMECEPALESNRDESNE